VLLGVAEGPNFPAVTGTVTRWLAPRERATALASALLSVPLALAIGGPVITHLLGWLDWRGTFLVLFGLSAVWIPLWLMLHRDDPASTRLVNQAELDEIRDQEPSRDHRGDQPITVEIPRIWLLLTNRTLLANYLAYFVYGYFLFFFMTWLPSYLGQVYDLDLTRVGLFTVAPWLAAAAALWAFGRISDHLLRVTGRLRFARSYLIAGSQLVAAIAIIPLALTPNLATAVGCITVAVAAAVSTNAVLFAVNIDVAPMRSATAFGIMNVAFAISGIAAPVITGWVVAFRGSFADAYWLMSTLAFLSVIVVLVFHNPDRDRRGVGIIPSAASVRLP
jgi:MFS transporter, ACS family, hexuronate transporter